MRALHEISESGPRGVEASIAPLFVAGAPPFGLLKRAKNIDIDMASIKAEDSATYAMIRKADTVGVFQIESRAQMSMLPRMAPKTFNDLVIEVAIVRPAPIRATCFIPIANLIVWPSLFEQQRRITLGAKMMACRGRVHAANGVSHLVAEHLIDQTELLNSFSCRDKEFTLPAWRGDEPRHPGGLGQRDKDIVRKVRYIYIPDLRIETLNVKPRNFR